MGTAAATGNSFEVRHSYVQGEIAFGHRFVDILSLENGILNIDLDKFHTTTEWGSSVNYGVKSDIEVSGGSQVKHAQSVDLMDMVV